MASGYQKSYKCVDALKVNQYTHILCTRKQLEPDLSHIITSDTMIRGRFFTILLLSVVLSYTGTAATYPSWMVMVRIGCDGTTERCLGAYVADGWIVTAARCFDRCSADRATTRVNINLEVSRRNRLSYGERLRSPEVLIHPEYDPSSESKEHDISLIKTNCPSESLSKIRVVNDCAEKNGMNDFIQYDLTDDGQSVIEYSVRRVNKNQCRNEHNRKFSRSQMLCFSKSQCSQNTVGLAMNNNTLFALSTIGLECAAKEESDFKTFGSLDLCRYSSWVNKQISSGDNDCSGSTTSPPTTPSTQPTLALPLTNAPIVAEACPKPQAPRNGDVSMHLIVATFTCDDGYILEGISVSLCIDGQWTHQQPSCRAITCPRPEGVANGKVETPGRRRANTLAVYTCNSGFTLGGFQQRRCNERGEWEGTPPSCHVTKQLFCSRPENLDCGTTSYSNGALLSGTVVTFTPNSNAQLLGPSQITCEDGKWSGPVPKCRLICDTNFNLKNGNFQLEFKDNVLDYKMTFTCNDGFEGKFYDEYTCSNGAWSPNPYSAQCVATCPDLRIKNANIQYFDSGSVKYAFPTCFDNYKLRGNNFVQCTDGVWQTPIPRCMAL